MSHSRMGSLLAGITSSEAVHYCHAAIQCCAVKHASLHYGLSSADLLLPLKLSMIVMQDYNDVLSDMCHFT